MKPSMIEHDVLNAIPIGGESPASTDDIGKLTGLTIRAVRESISNLVNVYGVPIVALRGRNNGVFIATTEEERQIGIAGYKHQINSMNIRLTAIQKADLVNWKANLKPVIAPMDGDGGAESVS
ncbi:DNA replication protein [Levilactobacillus yiduensis]|uniref:DNA replication protein n=1 Tax=Levilactobacillus yiduensis TaxID=2953880 RepID=UPI000EF30CB9|nr:DNA replication protein [Levilactobacillus yiduensis]AYM03670.1 DNA replication protein [Levilactobacillus brevis]